MVDIADGCVPRQDVISVMQAEAAAKNFTVRVVDDQMTVVINGIPEVYQLPEVVTRRMVARLTGKYGVKVEYFYHPLMVIPGQGTGTQH